MIQRRTNAPPQSMGSFVPLLGAGYAAPATRYCACGTRMSRYAGASETRCAPCEARLNPWQPPLPLERRRDAWREYTTTTCKCGAPKSAGAKRCLRCHIAAIGLGHPEWYGKTCACGGPKSEESRMCHKCRYPKTGAA
jgi:hypothetical protein